MHIPGKFPKFPIIVALGVFSHILLAWYIISNYYFSTTPDEGSKWLWCRACGSKVGERMFLMDKLTPQAQNVRQIMVFGMNVTVQTLLDKYYFSYDIITTGAVVCENSGEKQNSWFPGYKMYGCVCKICQNLLGWTFKSDLGTEEDTFHALILSHLFEVDANKNVLVRERERYPKLQYRMLINKTLNNAKTGKASSSILSDNSKILPLSQPASENNSKTDARVNNA